ncbi:superoxide dismutase [Cu-Zn]-like isoform X2 [Mustelus asterias]
MGSIKAHMRARGSAAMRLRSQSNANLTVTRGVKSTRYGGYERHLRPEGSRLSQRNNSFEIRRCGSAGPHYNPCNETHGAPQDKKRHVGDLGNIEADENGTAHVDMVDQLLRLAGKYAIIGRTLVVNEKEDDLGKAGTKESTESGTHGAGVAWGIIGIDEDPK